MNELLANCRKYSSDFFSRRQLLTSSSSVLLTILCAGCNLGPQTGGNPVLNFGQERDPSIVYPNPLDLGDMDSEFLWTQIIDTLDDYFEIRTEARVRRDIDQWSEGFVETFPQIGATALEPWRKDSSRGFERLQSTFQTMRRTAFVRVTPLDSGYRIQLEVRKELEDVDRSQASGEGSASIRHDGAVTRTDQQLRSLPITIGWIRQENDTVLEQRILAEIAGRTSNVEPPRRFLFQKF